MTRVEVYNLVKNAYESGFDDGQTNYSSYLQDGWRYSSCRKEAVEQLLDEEDDEDMGEVPISIFYEKPECYEGDE